MTWERMLERMQWRSPFGDLPDAWKGRRMRRACWPKRGGLVWHIWHMDDVGDQSTYEGGLVKGWPRVMALSSAIMGSSPCKAQRGLAIS